MEDKEQTNLEEKQESNEGISQTGTNGLIEWFRNTMPIRIRGLFGLIAFIVKIIVSCVSFVCVGKRGIILVKNNRDEWKQLREIQNTKGNLIEIWKTQWGSTEDYFYHLFCAVYGNVVWKKMKNKRKNFWWKGLFIFIMLAGFAAYLTFFIWSILHNEFFDSIGLKVLENGFLLFLLILLCAAVSKWMDVKKYQETWARHSMHQSLLEREMILFFYGMKPYDTDEKKVTFMTRILDIWGKNQEMFSENMKNEKEMMDAFNQLKVSK